MRVAATHILKLMNLARSLFRTGFNSSRCKTAAKMAVARIKLLRNKRQVVVKQMRRDIALLLQSGQDATARIRVEHVIREQNVLAANELIELFCELIVSRLSIIKKQRECSADLKEGIASLIFAAPRCSEIPELVAIRDVIKKKYGKDFVSAATDLRPNCGVNRMLIDKLSVRNPTGQLKLKVMKEIAKEYQIEWDTAESELELLKSPEELLEGPNTFVSATSLPLNPPRKTSHSAGFNRPSSITTSRGENDIMHFEDSASAAKAAAESAQKAIAAAQAAAYLAKKEVNVATQPSGFSNSELNVSSIKTGLGSPLPSNSTGTGCYMPYVPTTNTQHRNHQFEEVLKKTNESEIFIGSHNRRRNEETDIKFDESDSDEVEMDEPANDIYLPPERPPPAVPSSLVKQDVRVHPKLPDYDALAAQFEALKYRKSST